MNAERLAALLVAKLRATGCIGAKYCHVQLAERAFADEDQGPTFDAAVALLFEKGFLEKHKPADPCISLVARRQIEALRWALPLLDTRRAAQVEVFLGEGGSDTFSPDAVEEERGASEERVRELLRDYAPRATVEAALRDVRMALAGHTHAAVEAPGLARVQERLAALEGDRDGLTRMEKIAKTQSARAEEMEAELTKDVDALMKQLRAAEAWVTKSNTRLRGLERAVNLLMLKVVGRPVEGMALCLLCDEPQTGAAVGLDWNPAESKWTGDRSAPLPMCDAHASRAILLLNKGDRSNWRRLVDALQESMMPLRIVTSDAATGEKFRQAILDRKGWDVPVTVADPDELLARLDKSREMGEAGEADASRA